MRASEGTTVFDMSDEEPLALLGALCWERVTAPGLAVSAEDVVLLAGELRREYAVHFYKNRLECLWICCIGGTGTGKSTVFNGIVGHNMSPAGVERPMTTAPVAYGHAGHPVEKNYPFDFMYMKRISAPEALPAMGDAPGTAFLYVEHQDDRLGHLVFVDTPDMDSLEKRNRNMAEALYLLSHAVIFVASQEKYADDIPSRFLDRMNREGKPFYILFNKSDAGQGRDELLATFRNRGLSIPDKRFFTIPFMSSADRSGVPLREALQECINAILDEYALAAVPSVKADDRERGRRALIEKTAYLLSLEKQEEEAAWNWLKELDALTTEAADALLDEMAARHDKRNLSMIKKKLAAIFSSYDVLAKPRNYITTIMRVPLRLLGIVGSASAGAGKNELLKAREEVDNSPIFMAMDRLNLLVIERLSPPAEEAPLFNALRDRSLPFDEEHLARRIEQEQEVLARWLETTIGELAEGLPRSKKLGIYSTSMLWGTAIISFQTVLGGGLALLELAFDAVLAPFITKGSVDLFIYRELRAITREMNSRYQAGIHSIFAEQKERYARVLEDRLAPAGTIANLRRLQEMVEQRP